MFSRNYVLGETLFSSKKRIFASLATLILVLSVPITLSLVFQQQDIRQRADVIDPANLCNGHGTRGDFIESRCGGYATPGNPMACRLTNPQAQNTQVYQCSDGTTDAYICNDPACVSACSSPPWCTTTAAPPPPTVSCPSGTITATATCNSATRTVTCTWSGGNNINTWNADIGHSNGAQQLDSLCRSVAPGANCSYAGQSLTYSNVSAGTYNCVVGGINSAPACQTQQITGASNSCAITLQQAPAPTATQIPAPTQRTAQAPQPTLVSQPVQPVAPTATSIPIATAVPTATSVPQPTATSTQPQTTGSANPSPTGSGSTNATINLALKLTGIGSESYNNSNPLNKTRDVTVSVFNSANNQKVKDIAGTVTYQDGTYKGTVSVPNLPAGTYYAKTKLDNTLAKKTETFTVSSGGTNTLTAVQALISGDLFKTNGPLGLQEYNAIYNCYNGKACTAETRALSDFNDDGRLDAKDLNILLVNFARDTRTGD